MKENIKKFFRNSFDLKTQVLIRAAIVGIVIGIVAVAFRILVEKIAGFLSELNYSKEHWYDWLWLPLTCALGGAFAGYITQRFAPDASGSGIPQVKYALNTETRIPFRTVIVKFFGGIVAIASGFSLGREGPNVQIGAGLASKISKLLGGTHHKRAVASGAGAGLAAAFNTPIAGVMFVIEELDKNFSTLSLGPAIVGSVAAAFTCRMLYGDFFTFHFQCDCPVNFITFPLFVFLGIAAGVIGTYFQRSILFSLDLYKNLIPKWLWGTLAGLITGTLGLWIPQALGGGHATLEGVLAGAFSWWLIPMIFIAKYFLTMVAYGSRVPGGMFMPALILGALLGTMLGNSVNYLIPGFTIDPASLAFVGMGAFFTAISRAPITSIIMLFELTGNYQLVLPLMFSCIIANISAEKLKQGSIYENLLKKAGLSLKEDSGHSYLQKYTVEDAMVTEVETVSSTMTLAELINLFDASHHTGFPVLDSGKLVGMLTLQDLQRALKDRLDHSSLVSSFMSTNLRTLTLNDNLHSAVVKLYENKIGRVLIVDDENPSQLKGIITRSDIINFEARVC